MNDDNSYSELAHALIHPDEDIQRQRLEAAEYRASMADLEIAQQELAKYTQEGKNPYKKGSISWIEHDRWFRFWTNVVDMLINKCS